MGAQHLPLWDGLLELVFIDALSVQSLGQSFGQIFALGLLFLICWDFICFFMSVLGLREKQFIKTDKLRTRYGTSARRLVLRSFEEDEFGKIGDLVLSALRPLGVGRFWPGRFLLPRSVPIVPSGVTEATNALFDTVLNGQVQGLKLHVAFYPAGPVFQSRDLFSKDKTIEDAWPLPEFKSHSFSEPDSFPMAGCLPRYDCFDFPLNQLRGLGVSLSKVQRQLLCVAVSGVMARGFGLSGQLMNYQQFLQTAQQFDEMRAGLVLTQPVLYQEMTVVTAWCHLMAGILGKNQQALTTALAHYELIEGFDWRQRDVSEWAGIKANETLAALLLMELMGQQAVPETDQLSVRVLLCSVQGMRHFRRDNFPASWGKMMIKLALAQGVQGAQGAQGVPGVFFGQVVDVGSSLAERLEAGDVAESSSVLAFDELSGSKKSGYEKGLSAKLDQVFDQCGVDRVAIEQGLDEAIAFWQDYGDTLSICEAYFAKGRLAKNTAKRHMGLQDWERAENAFLAALAHSQTDLAWFLPCRADIQYELGQLYLDWGTDFGDLRLLEKGIHYFTGLLEGEQKLGEPRAGQVALALARCVLNAGGLSDDAKMHRLAVQQFGALKKQCKDGARSADLDRGLSVARARLALLHRDQDEAVKAISEISAVIGQKGQNFPRRDVLLRLRARLRDLLFSLTGDEIALDRAVQDRRDLVALAQNGLNDLRWAVEVGDLVELLSRRQYRMTGGREDFHEAHYLLARAIDICQQEGDDGKAGEGYSVPFIQAGLYLKLGKLLATFARVQFDVLAFGEAVVAYDKYLALSPRGEHSLGRAVALHEVGQILMDCSEHYGQHEGLRRAIDCFAESYDIYLEARLMDQANRMRRFMENAKAAFIAYQVPFEETSTTSLRG